MNCVLEERQVEVGYHSPTRIESNRPLTATRPFFEDHGIALSVLSSAVLTACGGGGSSSNSGTPSSSVNPLTGSSGFSFPVALTDAEAARFLQAAQFSSSTAEIAAVRSGTYTEWLQKQFNPPPTATVAESAWDWLQRRGYGAVDANGYYFNDYPAQFMIWHQLFASPDAMRNRLALALSEFFVVSLQSAEFTWRSHAFAHYWDQLVENTFGNFRKMLKDVTLNPAMGYYLNTKGNQKENTATGRVPDENYAREVMQLLTIGLYQLNLDGSVKLGANGEKLETYSQADVTGLARVFTGYDFDFSDGVRHPVDTYTIESWQYARKPMAFTSNRHSSLEARFLGTTIPANTPGPAALDTAVDTLFNHPNVGPFFGRQMIQRLVTSNPSTAYVARVATVFNNNGAGVRGDLRAVWSAILLDDEARKPPNVSDTGFGKLREPMLRFLQWGRSFGLRSATNSWKMFDTADSADSLGQSPLRSPSVFNFFRPGFVPPGTAMAARQATAPEFQLVNETTVGGYLNYMQRVIRDGIYCPEPGVPQAAYVNYVQDVRAAYGEELAIVNEASALVRHLSLVLCAGQLTPATQTIMVAALNATPLGNASTEQQRLNRVYSAVLMVMACSEYLVQK